MSGWPGNRFRLILYLKPSFHKYFRTINSGFVLLEWIDDIILLRVVVDNLVIHYALLIQKYTKKSFH